VIKSDELSVGTQMTLIHYDQIWFFT